MQRVAQIKIPRRTKCNFSTTVWYSYTQISWFIYGRDAATILQRLQKGDITQKHIDI